MHYVVQLVYHRYCTPNLSCILRRIKKKGGEKKKKEKKGMEAILPSLDTAVVVDETPKAGLATRDRPTLPRYLRLLPEYGVVLCVEHGSCYAADSLKRHLVSMHSHLGKDKTKTLDYIRQQLPALAQTLRGTTPPRGRCDPVDGLPCHTGYYCKWPSRPDSTRKCPFLSTNPDAMRKHYASHAKQRPGVKAKPAGRTMLQTLSARHKNYFRVRPVRRQQRTRGESPSAGSRVMRILSAAGQSPGRQLEAPLDASMAPDLVVDIRARFDASQGLATSQSTLSGLAAPAEHVSEATPWLRQTGYDEHLTVFDLESIGHLYEKPKPDVEPLIYLICMSVDRVLRRAMDAIGNGRHQHHTTRITVQEARLLNTFQGGDNQSLDPIKPLDRSIRDYITV